MRMAILTVVTIAVVMVTAILWGVLTAPLCPAGTKAISTTGGHGWVCAINVEKKP